jgi:peptidoglycan/LPS O-acetylase OafA/YrhL
MSKTPAPTRLPGLEWLRLIAASCVLLLHVRAVFGGQRVFGLGYLGVDFFLMLSGFLMARVQEPRLAAGAEPIRFMAKRIWRLWPMMALGGVIGLPRLWSRSTGWEDFLTVAGLNLALLPVWGRMFVFPLNIPAWTILCELACNTLHVTGLWRLRRWGFGASLIGLLLVDAWLAWHFKGLDIGAKPANFLAGALRSLATYMLGIALARWWARRGPAPFPWWLALPLMPALLPLVWWLKWQGWLFDIAFVLVACPLMIAGALRLTRWPQAAMWAGRIAFPLFALQMPILQGVKMLGYGYWSGLAVAAVAGVAAAWAKPLWNLSRHRQM